MDDPAEYTCSAPLPLRQFEATNGSKLTSWVSQRIIGLSKYDEILVTMVHMYTPVGDKVIVPDVDDQIIGRRRGN